MDEVANNSKLFRFSKTVHPIKSYVTGVSTSFMPSEDLFFFEKPTMPSFRAYFITLIGVLVSWNYQLINDNWNVEKIHAFFLSLERGRLGLSKYVIQVRKLRLFDKNVIYLRARSYLVAMQLARNSMKNQESTKMMQSRSLHFPWYFKRVANCN